MKGLVSSIFKSCTSFFQLNYIPGSGLEIPLVIQLTVEDVDFVGQSESTLAGIEKVSLVVVL